MSAGSSYSAVLRIPSVTFYFQSLVLVGCGRVLDNLIIIVTQHVGSVHCTVAYIVALEAAAF